MRHIERKALQENARALQRTLTANPDDSKARVNLARSFLLLGLEEFAIREYTNVARQAIRQGDFERALAACRTILRIKPDLPMVVDMMAGLIARNPDGSGMRVVNPISEVEAADFMRRELENDDGGTSSSTDDSWDLEIDASSDLGAPAKAATAEEVDESTLEDLVAAASSGSAVPLLVDDGIDDDWEVIEVEDDDIVVQSDTTEISVSPQNLMQQIPLFSSLDLATFIAVMRDVQVRRAPANEWIYRDGDDLRNLFVIATGRVELIKRDGFGEEHVMGQVGVGELLGEGLLVRESRYRESARARERVELLVITPEALGAAIAHSLQVQEMIEETHRTRTSLRLLTASALFRTLSLAERCGLISHFENETHPPGSLIFREGETAQHVMLIGFGEVEVVRQLQGEIDVISKMAPGDTLGLLSCLTDVPLNTTTRAVGEVHLYRMAKPTLVELYNANEAFRVAADRAMAMRQLLVEAASAPSS